MNRLFEDILTQLKIEEISGLYTHEEVIPANLLRLKEAMLNIGQLVDPLIVDEKSKVILDGNHRVTVLEYIKCPRAVCQMVDYSSPEIEVGTWYPIADRLDFELLRKKGFRLEGVDFEAGRAALEKLGASFMVARKENGVKKGYLVDSGSYSLETLVEAQKKLMDTLAKTEFYYFPDNEGGKFAENGSTVLFRKSFTKKEIVEYAHAGKQFPPKSTRHLIPNRIIRLNMRLGWLHEGKEEASAYLERMLKERVYNGNIRRYSEPVIVIY